MRFAALPLFLTLVLFTAPAGSGSKQAVSSNLPDIDTSRGFLEMCAAVDKKLDTYSQEDIFHRGYCSGWMAGLTNGIHVAEAMHRVSEKNLIFCPPTGNSYGQMIHIIKKFIVDHPDQEHLPMGIIAGAALAEAFPCKENK